MSCAATTPPKSCSRNSPFFWIGGFAYALLGTLVAGATLVCANAPAAGGVLTVLERERPTMVNGFAASVAHVAQDPTFPSRDLSSIRRGNLYPIMPAAVRPTDPELHHTMLGMTEAGSVCLASEDEGEQPEARRGSFGRAVPGFEARVTRPDGGSPCAPGEIGELWFRGPFLMEGYLGRERSETFDGDDWFPTGDLVTVDEDGFFYFRGRNSDMIKTAGANVSPREVEAAILEVSGLVAHVIGGRRPRTGAGRGGSPSGAGGERRPREPAPAAAPVALRLQGAEADDRRPRRGGAHHVERQARPRVPYGSCSVSPDRQTIPALLAHAVLTTVRSGPS